ASGFRLQDYTCQPEACSLRPDASILTDLHPHLTGVMPALLQLHVEAETFYFIGQNVEADRGPGLEDVLALHHALVDLGAPVDVVRLDGEQLLQDVRGAVRLE